MLRRTKFYRFAVLSWFSACAAFSQPPALSQPGTRWTGEQLKQAVELARVGRKLTPKSWPNHARVAVCLSFDTDTEAPLLRDGITSATTLSASDFGAESGTPRILKMLDRYGVPATFFVTAVDAMLHPDMLAAILKSGRHEVGVHGWIHEFPPRLESEAEEERLLDQAIEYLTKATGQRPVGYCAPMQYLDRFVAYMKSKPGVWFATGAQIARYVKENRQN